MIGTNPVPVSLTALQRRGGGRGLVTACIGGSQGITIRVEAIRGVPG